MEIITKSATETQKFGQKIGSSLKGGEVLTLQGDLGSGKTTFVQGLAKGLRVTQAVVSPTFILLRSYDGIDKKLYHLDLYRLEKNVQQEVKNLGIDEIWSDPKNIVVIEWAEKIKSFLPRKTKQILFENLGNSQDV